ncbi:DEAD/DEAH box helicase family protein, partial [Planktomarina temperata]|nr:DEAD/DEAH box helicase family protein [Planktomarina temperata]
MKIITDYDSFQDLNKHLASLTTSNKQNLAGVIFENLCKYYLQTAPHYKSKLKQVWLLREVNEKVKKKLNLPTSDEGIDLIAETVDKKFWAIQCKYRSNPNSVLTIKGDLATFANLAFNHCTNIEHGLVLTTSYKPPLKSKYLKNIGFENFENFLALDDNDFEGWKFVKARAEGKKFKPKSKIPKPHQVAAINKCIDYYKNNDRGKIIMPCGTGKSLASFWIARKLNAKLILVAVPSLSLLQQTLKVWTKEFLIEGIEPDWLCVCSDGTVSDDLDSFVTDTSDMGFKITTDATDVKNWLSNGESKIKIVFTTYHSANITIQGAKNHKFDFAILDEAHKTVGHQSKTKALLINRDKIKIKKRLFMTATERLFRVKSSEYISMDNENDYGKIIYELSFKKAIETEPPIISDYKIITYNVEDEEAYELYKSNKFIQVRKEIDDNITAREFMTAVALRKAIKNLGIKNTISFHGSIRRANNFKKIQSFISKIYNEYGQIKTFHVSGSQSSGHRANEMRAFSKSTKSLMTNARCLTEGVDLPAVDCVVFTDPKRSKIDIVQAAGRALRLSPGKKFGYILIPLTISKNQTIEEAAKGNAFDEVASVVGSLSIQDDRIAEYLKAVSLGKTPSRGSPVDGLISNNILTKINSEQIKEAVEIKIWKKIAKVHLISYEECKAYAVTLNIRNA